MKTYTFFCSHVYYYISKFYYLLFFILLASVNLYADDDIELTGDITGIGQNYLIVQNTTFYVDQNTEFRGQDGEDITFSDLQIGDLVEVRGNSRGDGTYTATRVRLEEEGGNENEIEITGYVTSKGYNLFVIDNDNYYVDQNTEFRGRDGEPFSFDQIEVGDLLEVKAIMQSNGYLLATRVDLEDENNQLGEVEISGIIDSLTTNSIIIGEWEFFVDNQTVITGDDHQPISFSDLNVGDKAEVKAFRQSDNTYLAIRIKTENNNENEIEYTAQIESINGNYITIGGITFITDTNTEFLNHEKLPITIGDLVAGMFVEVKGIKNSDGTYYASRIKIEDFFREEIDIKGSISELGYSSFVVNGITFSVNSNTKVYDHMNNLIPYSDLAAGQLVEVKGFKTGETTALATRIKLEDRNETEAEGMITAKSTNSIDVNGLTVFVNNNTVILNHADQPITFDELSVNLFVEVKMINSTALRIKIEGGTNFSKLNGIALNVTSASFHLPSGIYNINSGTVAVDNNFNRINISQLTNNQHIVVWSVPNGSNNTVLQVQLPVNSPTGTVNSTGAVNTFELEQNYPNPFNPATVISFSIAKDQAVTLKIFNAIGEEVRTLINSNLTKGAYKISFDGSRLSSGLYFYRMQGGSQVQVKKMMLLK